MQRIAKQEARQTIKETPPIVEKDSALVVNPSPVNKNGKQGANLPPIPTSDSNTVVITPIDSSNTIDSLLPIAENPIAPIDSLRALAIADSLLQDSLEQVAVMQEAIDRQIRYSKDSVSTPVQYASADSMIYDLEQRKVYLYHNAEVFYEQYSLKAGYIEFNFLTNIATATCLLDSAGKEIECPFFDDKSQQFTSRRIEFNFKSKKGKVYDASTQQGDGFLLSNATKFISKGVDSSGNKIQDILYSQGCLYTTCGAEHPHFGIRASRAKIIPGKLIVVGPSFLEIMGSPTPIVLPFGFFPITKNKRSGLILSMDFDFSPRIGPGIRGIGFYYGENEYWDLKVTGDFYMRGSIRARALSNYNIRYKSSGTINIGYTRLQVDNLGAPDYSLEQSFNFNWTHNQAQQAHPSQTFTARVDFGTSDFYQNTFNDAESVLKQTFASNISYTKRFTGTPFTLSASVSHRQDTRTQIMTITLPRLTFSMNQIFPFKRKVVTGKQRWYERIGFSYTLTGSNTITTTDTALFQQGGLEEAIENAEYGLTHSPNLTYSFKLFNAINVEPNVRYSQRWFFYRNIQTFDTTTVIDPENEANVTYGTIERSREYGLFTTHNFSTGVNVNTQIFATGRFNIGKLRDLRATFSPRVGFNWSPDYSNAADYYYDSVRYDNRYLEQRRYNYFSYAPPAGRTANISYSLNTRIEGKFKKGVRDSLLKDPYKKMVLIPSINITGNYNMAADSNHFSTITFNTYTTLFKKLQLRFTSVFDPYQADSETNRRLAAFEFERNGNLVRVTSMQFSASTAFSSKDLVNLFSKKGVPKDPKKKEFDLLRSFSINYDLVVNKQFVNGIDSSVIGAHQISFSGGVNLSKGWSFSINRIGYSFKDERITFPDFTFARDLHCWQMGLSWQPQRQTWSFFLRAKPGSLGFLEVPVKQEFYDVF
ncbi:MAG: putative LPS assembly protein LptD [Aureispira sp.]